MMWNSGMGPGMWLIMAAGTTGLWVLVMMFVRAIFSDRSGAADTTLVPSPLHVLAGRLARGEITVEEYEQRRRALTGGFAPFDLPGRSSTAPPAQSAVSVPDPTKDRHRSS